ncbi:MAG: LptF/LptG family permease [Paludibacteraceae bacterium]|nr:LptF/LptG family permease [Paludibacteraceae bacterium]
MFKKIDIYVSRIFLSILFITLVVSVFILLMQFVWMHVNDLVGKGVELHVLAEFFVYAVASVVPLALPLSILLASLMTFGNLGEKFELTAMKSAGISLFRIMQPLTILMIGLAFFAFFFSNNVLPKAQTKLWTLIFSLRQKSPELDIPAGEFYGVMHGYHIYVQHKNPKTGVMSDVMIYDFSQGFQNASVMVAESAKILFTEDKRHLVLCLYNGESFENLERQKNFMRPENIPYRREMFSAKKILIDFNSDFDRLDESVLADQHVSKNVNQLVYSIDSVSELAFQRSNMQCAELLDHNYFDRDRKPKNILLPVEETEKTQYDLDSLYAHFEHYKQMRTYTIALEKAQQMRDKIDYNSLLLDDYQRYIRRHRIELHRKFTLAFACLIFFFIGAPLGAIIRRGGMGMPIVTSVVMFIIYYIIDNMRYKMAREALWPVWQGMWLSSFMLLPIGIFLSIKATTDSPLLNAEAWVRWFHRFKEKFKK